MNFCYPFLLLLAVGFSQCLDVSIQIDLETVAALVDNNFLSVTIGSSIIKDKFTNVDLQSRKLLALAKALTGHENRAEFYLRIGGSNADKDEFDPTMYIFNATEFDELCKFAYTLQWKLIFGLNSLERNKDGSWKADNAIELIDYAVKQGYHVQYELGNEPDLYPTHSNITIPPEQLAKDFKTLRQILNEKTRNHAMLIGPDMATLERYNYFEKFLSNVEEGVLDAVTFHHYYSSSNNITVSNFTSVQYLDTFIHYCDKAISIIQSAFTEFPDPPVWVGETSSTYDGGGNKRVGQSYAAGFVWLDKLGLAAQYNISVVIRQALKGAFYSLLDKHYNPNPDYWSSLLYKQLVGRTVLNVTGFLQKGRKIRVYAHCINRFGGRGYKQSTIVLMALNVDPVETAEFYLQKEFENLEADQYVFYPANGNLEDNNVMLNNDLLKMVNETRVPDLKPMRVPQPYILPPLRYGFFVIVDSYAPACDKVI